LRMLETPRCHSSSEPKCVGESIGIAQPAHL
jgi:hypothetical protein